MWTLGGSHAHNSKRLCVETISPVHKYRKILKPHFASCDNQHTGNLHLLSKFSKLICLKDNNNNNNNCWQETATSWTCSFVLFAVQLWGLILVRLTQNLTNVEYKNALWFQCDWWDSINIPTATIVGPKNHNIYIYTYYRYFLPTATCRVSYEWKNESGFQSRSRPQSFTIILKTMSTLRQLVPKTEKDLNMFDQWFFRLDMVFSSHRWCFPWLVMQHHFVPMIFCLGFGVNHRDPSYLGSYLRSTLKTKTPKRLKPSLAGRAGGAKYLGIPTAVLNCFREIMTWKLQNIKVRYGV